jgi:AmiR/NasT family two-component response regulator
MIRLQGSKIKRMEDRELLALVELGGYPNFIPLYQRLGYQVEMVNSVRKAQAWLKLHSPSVVVAEFYADPQFRDRISNLESLLATLQRFGVEAKVVVFIEADYLGHLEKVKSRYGVDAVLTYPIKEDDLYDALTKLQGV